MQLVKAAITNDIDGMENLGIYEVAPEDFALCEYVCTSKIDIQDKIRQGLDLIAEECM
jgi:Na+-transporting NADH:ubiquinone oxidoreductase subunit A